MIAIQLALCVQLGTLCIQLSHLFSAPKLLKNASFKLEPHYVCLFSPGFKKKGNSGGGRHYGKEVGETFCCLFSLCVHSSPLGKEVEQERNLRARKKKNNRMRKTEEG